MFALNLTESLARKTRNLGISMKKDAKKIRKAKDRLISLSSFGSFFVDILTFLVFLQRFSGDAFRKIVRRPTFAPAPSIGTSYGSNRRVQVGYRSGIKAGMPRK
jgi:hypothetical protein